MSRDAVGYILNQPMTVLAIALRTLWCAAILAVAGSLALYFSRIRQAQAKQELERLYSFHELEQ